MRYIVVIYCLLPKDKTVLDLELGRFFRNRVWCSSTLSLIHLGELGDLTDLGMDSNESGDAEMGDPIPLQNVNAAILRKVNLQVYCIVILRC